VFFLINRTTLQVFVTYLIGALYVKPLWFYKHQHDNLKCIVYNKLLKLRQSFQITLYYAPQYNVTCPGDDMPSVSAPLGHRKFNWFTSKKYARTSNFYMAYGALSPHRLAILQYRPQSYFTHLSIILTLIPLTWRIGWAHNNARK